MYRPTLRRQALRLGLLATLVVLALNACTGGQEQADRPRPLPEDEKALRPGEYRSEEFKPSLSFRVGKGWSSTPLEASDLLHVMRGETARLIFAVTHAVYKPSRTSSLYLVEVPKSLGWLVPTPSVPKNLQTGAGHGRRSQGCTVRRGCRGPARRLLRRVRPGLRGPSQGRRRPSAVPTKGSKDTSDCTGGRGGRDGDRGPS